MAPNMPPFPPSLGANHNVFCDCCCCSMSCRCCSNVNKATAVAPCSTAGVGANALAFAANKHGGVWGAAFLPLAIKAGGV